MTKRQEFELYIMESMGLAGRSIRKLQLTIESGQIPVAIIEEHILETHECVVRRFEFSEKDVTLNDEIRALQ